MENAYMSAPTLRNICKENKSKGFEGYSELIFETIDNVENRHFYIKLHKIMQPTAFGADRKGYSSEMSYNSKTAVCQYTRTNVVRGN